MPEIATATDASWLRFIEKHTDSLKGKSLLDVGCGLGSFLTLLTNTEAAEYWGIDHNQRTIERALDTNNDPRKNFVCTEFGQLLTLRPEFNKKFDIIKISNVTPYVTSDELRAMLPSTHALLKEDGCVMIQLPAYDMMGRIFTQDQEDLEATANQLLNHGGASTSRQKQDAGRLAIVYKRLANAFFSDVQEVAFGNAKVLIAKSPKEKIPQLEDIRFTPATLRLSPLPEEPASAYKQSY